MAPDMTVNVATDSLACGGSPHADSTVPLSAGCRSPNHMSPACVQPAHDTNQQYWVAQLAGLAKHARMVLHPVTHWRQLFSWDCGLACALMALKAVGHNCDYSLLRQLCPTTSIWTIDLAHLLRRFGLDVSFYTITLGPNPAFHNESFYLAHMQDDERRVSQLFRDACSAGIAVQQRSVCWQQLAAELMTGCSLVLVLVDKRKLDPWLIAADMCLPYALCGMDLGYAGHYILLVGWDAGVRQFLVRDPAGHGHGDVPRVTPEALDAARTAFGTDEDVLVVRHPSLAHNLLVVPQPSHQLQPVLDTAAVQLDHEQGVVPDGGADVGLSEDDSCVSRELHHHEAAAAAGVVRPQSTAGWFTFQQRGTWSTREGRGTGHDSSGKAAAYQGITLFQARVSVSGQQACTEDWAAAQDHSASSDSSSQQGQGQQHQVVVHDAGEQQPLLGQCGPPRSSANVGWYTGWYAYVWQTQPSGQQQQQQHPVGKAEVLGQRPATQEGVQAQESDAAGAAEPDEAVGHGFEEQQQGSGQPGSKANVSWGSTVSGSAWSSFWCWAPAWGMATGSAGSKASSSRSTGSQLAGSSRPGSETEGMEVECCQEESCARAAQHQGVAHVDSGPQAQAVQA